MTHQIKEIVIQQLQLLQDAVGELDSSELITMSTGLAATLNNLPIDFLCREHD